MFCVTWRTESEGAPLFSSEKARRQGPTSLVKSRARRGATRPTVESVPPRKLCCPALAVWLVAFVAICASGFVALRFSQERERLPIVRLSEEMTEVNLHE